MLYPRDPSLDPQLVWKGKDEQDTHPLEVPVVPIYIQEKVHPQALIENLRTTVKAGEKEPELLLFDDFPSRRTACSPPTTTARAPSARHSRTPTPSRSRR